MRKFAFFSLLMATLSLHAQELVVGGDLSLVPAYEQAGDKWLNVKGEAISDLLKYVHDECGWNAVRVRLFVDPSGNDDPSACQDLAYVTALGKRVKEAGMKLVIDLQYSDTWADPSHQKIPAAWTDHTPAGLCKSIADYTYSTIGSLIDAGATPDYVQLGNEVTYGLLWNTSDGKYPSSSALYAAAGYCNTWSSSYSSTSAFPRTARLLNNAAMAVHKAFTEAGKDSTDVQLILHTASTKNMATNSDHFYKYIEKAGFTNYDIIGLSYYPFEDGYLSTFETNLKKLATDFPTKMVQVMETAYYNTTGATPDYDLTTNYPYNALGQYNYLIDLMTMLNSHTNVSGLYYWMPEECGSGYKSTVMQYALSRGLWASSNGKSHTLLVTPKGNTSVSVLQYYLKGNIPEKESAGGGQTGKDMSSYYKNLGFELANLTGWITDQSWSKMWPNNLTSWASSDVVTGTYTLELWNSSAKSGRVIHQNASSTLPNGTYCVTCKAHADNSGFYLFAGTQQTPITEGQSGTYSVTAEVANGALPIGIGATTSTSAQYLYADDFKVFMIAEDGVESINENLTSSSADVYNLAGQRVSRYPKGIYVKQGKKFIR